MTYYKYIQYIYIYIYIAYKYIYIYIYVTVPIVPKYSRYSQWGCNFWDTINPTGPQCLQVLHMQLGRNTIQLLGPVFILP